MKKNDGTIQRKTAIGIDIGGTNADAALYDCVSQEIYAYAKVPTDHADYAGTLEQLLSRLVRFFPQDPQNVVSLNLSTTLSTNALLEGKGAPVHLLLIGFEKKERLAADIMESVKPASVTKVCGGHTSWGEARASLDEEAVHACAAAHKNGLFAVSGLFSPRNPAHEIRAAEILRREAGGTVTCGHEIARVKLNAVKRTVTACLNASLQPLIAGFIGDAEKIAAKFGLSCPIMFLKSDSTLVSAAWCRQFPIETIFSGPAASLRGACYLVRDRAPAYMLMADIGGTSTDIGRVEEGRPVFSEEGATIGAYRTMIPSLDISSVALGGDSRVAAREDGGLEIGPRRVVPICRSGTGAESGYTPTDAMNTLGKAHIGDTARSEAVSERLGAEQGIDGRAFASLVWQNTLARLEENLAQAERDGKEYLRVYVGAPGQVFAAESKKNAVRIDPEMAAVASAVGAASSTVELKCEAVIQRSFLDEIFVAFLPHKKLRSPEIEPLLHAAENEIAGFLSARAKEMGIPSGNAAMEKEYSYLGKKQTVGALASVTIRAEFIPD